MDGSIRAFNPVCSDGYESVNADFSDGSKDWVIIPRSNHYTIKNLLASPDMHMRFIECHKFNPDPDMAAYVKFADQFGLITNEVESVYPMIGDEKRMVPTFDRIKSLESASRTMTTAHTTLLGYRLSIEEKNDSYLKSFIVWSETEVYSILVAPPQTKYIIASNDPNLHPNHSLRRRWEELSPGHYNKPALYLLQDYIRENTTQGLGIAPVWSVRSPIFRFEVESALVAMWIFFMRDVEGKQAYCAYCNNPMEQGRKGKIYCKPACKAASSRESKNWEAMLDKLSMPGKHL